MREISQLQISGPEPFLRFLDSDPSTKWLILTCSTLVSVPPRTYLNCHVSQSLCVYLLFGQMGSSQRPGPPLTALWILNLRTEHSILCIIFHLSDTCQYFNFLNVFLFIWNKHWHKSIQIYISHILIMCNINVGKPQNHKKSFSQIYHSWSFYQIAKNPAVETIFCLDWGLNGMICRQNVTERSRHMCLRGIGWGGDLFLYCI